MNDHLSLGLTENDRVDNALGGGIPAGAIGLIEGAEGAGKSALMQRFAYGLADEGAYVSYVSTELTAQEFIAQMDSLSYDVVDLLLDEQLLFLHADTNTFDDDRELVSRLLGADVLWRADVVIIDSLSGLVANDPRFEAIAKREDEDRAMEAVIKALKGRTAAGKTVLLTADPDAVSDRTLRPLRNTASLFFELQTNTVGQEVRKSMVVRRFEGMAGPVNDTVSFSVEQGRGITIVTRTVA